MPDRMFREGWKTSKTIDRVDEYAENFFFRLCLTADKNGIYHAEPELLRAAVYPLKTTLRMAEVRRRRDVCVRAGLLRQWIASDGRPYVQVLKFGQRVPLERPKFPLPPGEPDDTGQESLGLPEPPLSEMKGDKGRGKHARKRATPSPHVMESWEEGIARLRAEWAHLDIDRELGDAEANRRRAGKDLDLAWFEKHWLPNAGARKPKAQPNPPTAVRINDQPRSDGPSEFEKIARQDPTFARELGKQSA